MGDGNNKRLCYNVCLLISIAINLFFAINSYLGVGFEWKNQRLAWSGEAAAEAEAVAAISCSGHGRAYLDGLIVDGKPVCECNSCYEGPDCSRFKPHCPADANGGDPMFMEPFWMQHPDSSAVVIAGWHRMSYDFPYDSDISKELEKHIRRTHALARNAITEGKYIVFGCGSTQLMSAAVYALSMNLSSPAKVVAASPYYPTYKSQTDFFQNKNFVFEGDAYELMNSSDNTANIIEFVTSPNNPDGYLKKAVCQGESARAIHDHAYYWPHFTAIPAPADGDIMLFTTSKLTGHAGSRFGWAFVKDETVYNNILSYITTSEMSISTDTQLRVLKLMKAILHDNGTELFNYAFQAMSYRWRKLNQIISSSKRFTIQEIPPQFCNFFEKVREPSPAYAWLRCERDEDAHCYDVLKAANIIGRRGNLYNADDRYVRLSLLKADDEFNWLIHRLGQLVAEEADVEDVSIYNQSYVQIMDGEACLL